MLSFYRKFRIICLFTILLGSGSTQARMAVAGENLPSAALDGMVFFGDIARDDDDAFVDNLSFADGVFWSEICIRCGFKPGKYWTRTESDGVHFRGDLEGSSGSFSYEGQVIDGKVVVEIVWKKERWYWTSSAKLNFQGRMKPGETPYLSSEANQIAINALKNELPDFCW